MRASRIDRLWRGSIAALIATFVALLSHVTAGGEVPGIWGIAVPLVLAITASTLLAGKALSLWRLSIAVVISQALFHVLFVLGATGDVMTEMQHTAHTHTMAGAMTGGSAGAAGASLAMWVMHAVAAVVTIVALYRGERALRALRDLGVGLVSWLRSVAWLLVTLTFPADRRPTRQPVQSRPFSVHSLVSIASVGRRGPPLRVTL